jgi:hypothetical protein
VTTSEDRLHWLQEWVRREFGEGPVRTANPWVQIETLDAGWATIISLTDTTMELVEFEEIEALRSDRDWIHCWVDGGTQGRDLEWQGRGGSGNLEEIVGVFRSWVERSAAREPT